MLKRRKHTPENKAKIVIASRRWKRANKIKERAHKAVARAIASGKLIKPETCTQCPNKEKVEGHHPDYEKSPRGYLGLPTVS